MNNQKLTSYQEQSQKYMMNFIHRVPVTLVKGESSIRRLGNVPSLMLVSSTGVVRKRWRGLLSLTQEAEVRQALGLKPKG